MLAMQYSFTLPADYPMEIIRQRIATAGPLLDNCPQLMVKAYLYALKGEHGAENRYAPFYLWNSSQGMSEFLLGQGFVGLTQSFGWPQVDHWLPWLTHFDRAQLSHARFASIERRPIAPFSNLSRLRSRQRADPLALASVTAFDPAAWQLLHMRLWRTLPARCSRAAQWYAVGHVSAPFDNSAAPHSL